MSLQDLTTVLGFIPKLEPEELQQVKNRITGFTSLGGGVLPPQTSNNYLGDYLFDGCLFELRRRGLMRRDGIIARNRIPSNYYEDAAEVRKLLAGHVGNKLKPVELASLGRLLARCLADYLERGMVPILPKTLLQNISKVPVALDAAYPGYLEAGLLSFCWRK